MHNEDRDRSSKHQAHYVSERETESEVFQGENNALLCHADKVEAFFLNNSTNSLLLPEIFPELKKHWAKLFHLNWRTEKNSWNWTVNGWNDEVRLTFQGPIRDIPDGAWPETLFSPRHLSDLDWYSRRGWSAVLRITDKKKRCPATYCGYLTEVFALLESSGIMEKPRTIEIALDSYEEELTEYVKHYTYLWKSNPLDLCHWVNEAFCPGGSPDGTHTEYSMLKTFRNSCGENRRQNTSRRELVCYPNREHGFYRVELRLGSRYLSEFYGSNAYHNAIESSAVSPLIRQYQLKEPSRTLDLLGFIPYFVRQHLTFGSIHLEELNRKRPATRFLELEGRSIRDQRYQLAKIGLRPSIQSQRIPPIRFLLPEQVADAS